MIGRHDLWYKDAIFYSLDGETFQDSNGDGVGDFPGLTRRLEHIAGLGATCLWLLPFHPTPNRDNGYDMIIMGSHGHGALGRVLMGSVSSDVLAKCGIPVLLIR